MKDVSKQTLGDLIKFIYSGEVSVNQSDSEEFFNTARALEIKGLSDENHIKSFDLQTPMSTWSTPALNRFQYQSSRTVLCPNPVNSIQSPKNYYCQQPWEEHQEPDNFDNGANGQTAENGYEMGYSNDDDNNPSYNMDDDDSSIDQKFDVQDNHRDANYHESGTDEKQTKVNAPKAKRVKRPVGK